MKLLAIDTSTQAQVLGLLVDDELIDRTELVGREHSQRILPAIVSLLADASVDKGDLDGIVFGQGPGSFTGLRIAVGVVQGLAYGLQIPVVPISTLACLAQGEYRRFGDSNIVVAITARRTEVYFGSYVVADGIVVVSGEEGVHEVTAVPRQPFNRCAGVGGGFEFRSELEQALGVTISHVSLDVLPALEDLMVLGVTKFRQGGSIHARYAEPQYLRERVASRPGEKS